MDKQILAAIRDCFAERNAKESRRHMTKLELKLQRIIHAVIKPCVAAARIHYSPISDSRH